MSVTGGSLLTIKSSTLNTTIQIQGRQDTDRLTFVDHIIVDHMTVVTEYTVICICNRYTLYSKIHLYVGLCPPPNENCLIFLRRLTYSDRLFSVKYSNSKYIFFAEV